MALCIPRVIRDVHQGFSLSRRCMSIVSKSMSNSHHLQDLAILSVLLILSSMILLNSFLISKGPT